MGFALQPSLLPQLVMLVNVVKGFVCLVVELKQTLIFVNVVIFVNGDEND